MTIDLPPLKPLRWVGPAKRELQQLPGEVQHIFGFALYLAQAGDKHVSAKPLRGFGGAGVLAVVEDHDGSTYRAVYTVKLEGVIYVLHAFQKKSTRGIETPKHVLDLVRARLKAAEADHRRQRKG